MDQFDVLSSRPKGEIFFKAIKNPFNSMKISPTVGMTKRQK